MSANDIYVENFRESVRVCQKCIMWCIAASFSGLLLAWKMFQTPASEGVKTRIPVLFGEVRLADAWGLALLVYIVLGAYAAYAAGKARLNAGKLATEEALLDAMRLYPSLATARHGFFRLGAAILPMALMAASCIIEILREHRTPHEGNYWTIYLLIVAIAIAPQGFLLRHLRRSVVEAPPPSGVKAP